MDKMKPDQERVRTLLTDTVTLLCKNGLQYSKELKVQGLLGITLDNDDVFVVHINEIFNGLLGAQVSAIRAEDTSGSAIAAADSATSDVSLKSRKGIPQKYECPSPSASNKRKARPPTMSPMVHVKKERVEDDIVIMDSKSLDSSEFNADEIGEGDREAMRKSYGEMLEAPSSKRRLADSSGSFRETQSQKQSGPFVTGTLVRDTKETLGESDTIIEDSSLDDSSSGLGPVTDGQTAYDNSAGCSAWDGQETGQTQSESAQDSVVALPPPPLTSGTDVRMRLPTMVPMGAAGLEMAQPFRRPRYSFKPFECPEPSCGRKFYHRGDVYRHQRINHGANHIGKPHQRQRKRSRPSYYKEHLQSQLLASDSSLSNTLAAFPFNLNHESHDITDPDDPLNYSLDPRSPESDNDIMDEPNSSEFMHD